MPFPCKPKHVLDNPRCENCAKKIGRGMGKPFGGCPSPVEPDAGLPNRILRICDALENAVTVWMRWPDYIRE